jgi:dUTP pyrophosphatase
MKTTHLTLARLPGNDDLTLPRYMSEAASGMDVCAAVTEDVVLEPGDVKLIPTGLQAAVDPGYEIQVRPRSGLALKHGITLVNSPGTIDADYRGEIRIILGNMGKDAFTVTRGMRIAQFVIQQVVRAEIRLADSLDATERGEGGFGSSGV